MLFFAPRDPATWRLALILGCSLLAAALLAWSLFPRPQTLTFRTETFSLLSHQTALLQFRHIHFCDGQPHLSVSLSFAGSGARRDLSMECGQSTRLLLRGPATKLSALLTLSPAHRTLRPDATLQIVSRTASGTESVEILHLLAAGPQ